MNQPILIAPFKTGLDTDIEPWIAPEDSFREINNINIKNGYLQKRQGYRPFGFITPMGATKAITGITNANPGVVTSALHGYSSGDKVFITSVTGMVSLNNKIFTITVINPNEFSINLNTTDLSAYIAEGTVALTSITTDRVMGITRYIESDNTKTTLAFNAKRANRFDGTTNTFVRLDSADIFKNNGEYDYVWSANWQSGGGTNRLYFTNGVAGTTAPAATLDGIRYYDGTTDPNNTVAFNPTIGSGTPTRTLVGCKLIFSLGQRLIVLNTYEYDTSSTENFPQRARWCAKQDPSNWDDVTAGGGGYADAATGDQIISAQVIQNQIIVFFTNSVWTLLPTSDPNRAFRWKKINNFRACDGKMASIGYDKYAVAFGIRGITATDGVETRRVDNRIENFTTDNINVDEFQKVFCERSYANTRAWTLYNSVTTSDNENDSALILDDNSKSFSTYSINLNCLGYGNFTQDYGLDDFTVAKDLDLSLEDFGDEDLFSYFWQENQETFLGGDLNGGVYVLETDGDDDGSEISSTFTTNAWNPFKAEGVECQLNYIDLYIDTNFNTKAQIDFFKDTEVSPYISKEIDFLPNLGFVAHIINATATNPVSVNCPQHGLSTGDKIYIYGVEGMTDINSGESSDAFTVTVTDVNNFVLNGINGTSFSSYTGGGAVYLKKFYRTKTWKRIYGGGIGFQHRIRFTSSGTDKQFRIHSFKPYFKKIRKRDIN